MSCLGGVDTPGHLDRPPARGRRVATAGSLPAPAAEWAIRRTIQATEGGQAAHGRAVRYVNPIGGHELSPSQCRCVKSPAASSWVGTAAHRSPASPHMSPRCQPKLQPGTRPEVVPPLMVAAQEGLGIEVDH